ncbi:hypothetical protein E4T44_06552 [Aureobasidium sp. EXF-8845]|nr:hypothetical protein E4T44_06552 [Aureobasidium sp. EXF-8845]KAI4856387.1 hypothetical protein E4T45_02153 [Aureobasidium sp. EXF-8846]
MQPQKRLKDKSSVDELLTIDDNDPGKEESTTRITENGTVIPEDPNKNQSKGVGVCRLELGNYSAMFELGDTIESHTLHLLVHSNDKLDPDDEDVCRIRGATLPTASLNPQRFTHATLYTAWLYLRTGRKPYTSARSMDQRVFPDGGQLVAAATLFDLGLALRCPKLQRAALEWYQETRSVAWSAWFAQPSNWQWGAEKMPEGRYWTEEYAAWLQILKAHDPEMIRLRKVMMEATRGGYLGLATDLPELDTLEPRQLYDFHMGESVPSEVAEVIPTS